MTCQRCLFATEKETGCLKNTFVKLEIAHNFKQDQLFTCQLLQAVRVRDRFSMRNKEHAPLRILVAAPRYSAGIGHGEHGCFQRGAFRRGQEVACADGPVAHAALCHGQHSQRDVAVNALVDAVRDELFCSMVIGVRVVHAGGRRGDARALARAFTGAGHDGAGAPRDWACREPTGGGARVNMPSGGMQGRACAAQQGRELGPGRAGQRRGDNKVEHEGEGDEGRALPSCAWKRDAGRRLNESLFT